MSALKPTPKAPATPNSPASSCVTRNPAIPAACSTELISSVSNPPIRSETAPQTWRLMKPTPRRTDSMTAPCVGVMPRSEQNATRCACGIDMVTQHRKAAIASIANTTLGRQPAEQRDRALENRRPDCAGEIAAARDQRERRAAPAVEPAADIDIERRVEPGIAKKPHEDAMADIEVPGLAERRDEEPDADRHSAKEHGPANAIALGAA